MKAVCWGKEEPSLSFYREEKRNSFRGGKIDLRNRGSQHGYNRTGKLKQRLKEGKTHRKGKVERGVKEERKRIQGPPIGKGFVSQQFPGYKNNRANQSPR